MPNWVNNALTIIASPAELDVIKAQLSQPYETSHKDYFTNDAGNFVEERRTKMHESVLSFWNMVKPTDLETYFEGEVSKPASTNIEDIAASIAEQTRTGMDWYHWNIRNWGCKWEACEIRMEQIANGNDTDTLTYHFDTPWSAPIPAITALSKMYPEIDFHLYFEEEQGWGGEVILRNGLENWQDEWDIPDSHEENEFRRGSCWKCEEFLAGFCEEDDLYDDCPADLMKAHLKELEADLTSISESGNVAS